ncbi:hypothetical protein GPALN_015078 [Globodera pallida]|nr:hypothetical protein GPALN_015078 [Globodera pallida]
MDGPVPLEIKTECSEARPKIPAHLQKAFWECVLGISTVLETVERRAKGVKENKMGETCTACHKTVPVETRLHHTNVVHLKLSLYMCPVCGKQVPYVIYGIGHCRQHFRVQHSNMAYPSDDAYLCPDYDEKMLKIVQKTRELFLKSSD